MNTRRKIFLGGIAAFVIANIVLYTVFLDKIEAGAPARDDTLVIQTASGATHTFTVEIAATEADQERGLMFRESMPADHGMLFEFEGMQPRYFWMKNTYIPLDIIYIDDKGKIVSIASNTTPKSLSPIPSRFPARAALEINGGESEKRGIRAGDTVRHPFFTE